MNQRDSEAGSAFTPLCGKSSAGQLRHGDVVLLRDPAQQEIAMRVELGVSAPTERLGSATAPRRAKPSSS